MVKLGQKARDKVSGFEGIATARTHSLVEADVESKVTLTKDGQQYVEFDVQSVEIAIKRKTTQHYYTREIKINEQGEITSITTAPPYPFTDLLKDAIVTPGTCPTYTVPCVCANCGHEQDSPEIPKGAEFISYGKYCESGYGNELEKFTKLHCSCCGLAMLSKLSGFTLIQNREKDGSVYFIKPRGLK